MDVCLTSTVVAFDNDKHVNEINNDVNSIKIALNNYTKIFLGFGFFSYGGDETSFIIETYDIKNSGEDTLTIDKERKILLIESKIIHNLNDEYYDRYKYSLAGYGIYLDKNLNVEYGYYKIYYVHNVINSIVINML